jgi:hypothetical protein
MPFPDPDDKPDTLAQAAEYWVIGALVVGAWAYGIYCGIRALLPA